MNRFVIFLCCWMNVAQAAQPDAARCVVPAKAGGGFDLTCQLIQDSLNAKGATARTVDLVYQPGGIGALAFKQAVTQTRSDAATLTAFSSGSLLNLAQGRFGPYNETDVRWLASIGMDHGVIAVHQNAPYKNLSQLVRAWRSAPQQLVFGAGGSIGSQDWIKAALLARLAGINHKTMRFVAFEGGGDALSALSGGHVHVLAGDVAEVGKQIDQGAKVNILAVLADERLGGRWSHIPTAKEQGFDLQWPILRGVYLGPDVGDAVYLDWQDALAKATSRPQFEHALTSVGLKKTFLTGRELEKTVQLQVQNYRKLAASFGLSR